MSNKELCLKLIDSFEEKQLADVLVLLQSVKNMLNEAQDDAFCLKLYNDYLDDPEPDKDEAISIHEFAATLDVKIS